MNLLFYEIFVSQFFYILDIIMACSAQIRVHRKEIDGIACENDIKEIDTQIISVWKQTLCGSNLRHFEMCPPISPLRKNGERTCVLILNIDLISRLSSIIETTYTNWYSSTVNGTLELSKYNQTNNISVYEYARTSQRNVSI